MSKKRFDFVTLFDKVTVEQIFIFWIATILIFAVIFYLLSNFSTNSLVINSRTGEKINNTLALTYFSFITATSTGYGDLVPLGASRTFAIIEVVLGLLIFGMLISKLVSFKQQVMLNEVYEISFHERITGLRDTFYLYRTNVNRAIEKFNAGNFTKKDIRELGMTIAPFENALSDSMKILCRKEDSKYVKQIDDLTIGLLLKSIELSMSKTLELFVTLNAITTWKNDYIEEKLGAISDSVLAILNYYSKHSNLKIREEVNDIYKLRSSILKEFERFNDAKIETIKEDLGKWI